jgi:hypothetical protein
MPEEGVDALITAIKEFPRTTAKSRYWRVAV